MDAEDTRGPAALPGTRDVLPGGRARGQRPGAGAGGAARRRRNRLAHLYPCQPRHGRMAGGLRAHPHPERAGRRGRHPHAPAADAVFLRAERADRGGLGGGRAGRPGRLPRGAHQPRHHGLGETGGRAHRGRRHATRPSRCDHHVPRRRRRPRADGRRVAGHHHAAARQGVPVHHCDRGSAPGGRRRARHRAPAVCRHRARNHPAGRRPRRGRASGRAGGGERAHSDQAGPARGVRHGAPAAGAPPAAVGPARTRIPSRTSRW